MTEIFCDEPIRVGYNGYRNGKGTVSTQAWLGPFQDVTYHVTEGYRIVLETEHFFISLSHNGVTKTEKNGSIAKLEQTGERLVSFLRELGDEGVDGLSWKGFEFHLFFGQKVLDVQRVDDGYVIAFTDFKMKLVPHELPDDDLPMLEKWHD